MRSGMLCRRRKMMMSWGLLWLGSICRRMQSRKKTPIAEIIAGLAVVPLVLSALRRQRQLVHMSGRKASAAAVAAAVAAAASKQLQQNQPEAIEVERSRQTLLSWPLCT